MGFWPDFSNAVSSVTSTVENTVSNVVNNVASDAQTAVSDVETAVGSAVSNTVSDAETAVSDVESSVGSAVSNISSSVSNAVSNAVSSVSNAVNSTYNSVSEAVNTASPYVSQAENLPAPPVKPSKKGSKKPPTPKQKEEKLIKKPLKKIEKALIEPTGILKEIEDLPEIIISDIKEEFGHLLIDKVGEWLVSMFPEIEKGVMPSVDATNILFNSPTATEEVTQLVAGLALGTLARLLPAGLGNEAFYMANAEYPARLPESGELLSMEIRHVFQKSYRNFFSKEQPTEIWRQSMQNQGFDKFWQDSIWSGHWKLLSVQDVMDMFHRNRDGIVPDSIGFDKDDLELWYKWNGILPEYRDRLTYAAYEPIPFYYVEGLLSSGILATAKDAENAYLDIGMKPSLSKMLAVKGMAVLSEKTKSISLSAVIDMYKKGIASYNDTFSDVMKIGFSQSATQKLMELATSEIQKKSTHELKRRATKQASTKKLTSSEALEAFRYGIIDKSVAEQYIIAYGYSGVEAQILLKTAEVKYKMVPPVIPSKK